MNEIFTNTLGPVDDAIEFYNPTNTVIDLGGMWLSDRVGSLDSTPYILPVWRNVIINVAFPTIGPAMGSIM